MAPRKSQNVMKENKIPLGKKRETLEKVGELKKTEKIEFGVNQIVSKNKPLKTTIKSNKKNEPQYLKVININVAPTDTSLTKAEKNPRKKLSTIKEIKELDDKAARSNIKIKTKSNILPIVSNDTTTLIKNNNIQKDVSTKLIENVQKENCVDNFNNSFDDLNIKPSAPEVVLSPFVCTTRGQKWKPSPRKPPKLSELFDKYEDDNVADTYKKKLDVKTIELQGQVNYWSEFASENKDIPQFIKDDIDVVCGQTKLLTTDKFMQMRSLVEEFDNKSGSMPITTDDLDGFWDMLLLQVQKLEGQFSQLVILKENNWKPLQPVAKKVINKVSKINKRPEVKSKFTEFLKNQKLLAKTIPNTKNYGTKNDSTNSKFNEMKLSDNICLISSTPTSSNQKNVSFTPMLLKTMELSYVARRSGMTPIVLAEPHVSPLKPALKNPEQEKGIKRKNIQFKSPETPNGFVTPENSCNDNANHKKSLQDRIPTPHTLKSCKVNRNNVDIAQNIPTININVKPAENEIIPKTKAKKKTAVENLEATQNNCSMRRSSRLAKKPSKNYKC